MHFPLLQPQKDTGKGACGPPDPHCPLSGYRSAAPFIYEPVHELVEQLAQLCGGESGAIGAGLQEAQVVVARKAWVRAATRSSLRMSSATSSSVLHCGSREE